MKKYIMAIIIFCICLIPLSAAANNPANIVQRGFRAKFGIDGAIDSNSLNLALIRNLHDQELTEQDKNKILNSIHSAGFATNLTASPYLDLGIGNLGLRVAGESFLHTNVPKDVFKLALFGNELNQEYDFADFTSTGMATVETALTFGFSLEKLFSALPVEDITMAASVKHLSGIGYADFIGEGSLKTVSTYDEGSSSGTSTIEGEGNITGKYSTSGSGFAYDVGLRIALTDKLTIDGSLLNTGAISWNNVNYIAFEGEAIFDVTNLDEMQFDIDDNIESSNDTLSIKIPQTLRGGFTYKLMDNFILSGDITHTKTANDNTISKLSTGVKYSPFAFLPLRANLSKMTNSNLVFSCGLGLNFKHLTLDINMINPQGFWNDKTIGSGIAMQFSFGI